MMHDSQIANALAASPALRQRIVGLLHLRAEQPAWPRRWVIDATPGMVDGLAAAIAANGTVLGVVKDALDAAGGDVTGALDAVPDSDLEYVLLVTLVNQAT